MPTLATTMSPITWPKSSDLSGIFQHIALEIRLWLVQ